MEPEGVEPSPGRVYGLPAHLLAPVDCPGIEPGAMDPKPAAPHQGTARMLDLPPRTASLLR